MNAGRETSGWLESVGMAACTVVLVSIFAITPAALELAQHVTSAWQYTAQQFEVVNASTPVTQILLPTIFFGLLTLGIMALNPRRGRLARAAVITMLVALYTTYMAFRLFATLNLSSPASAVFSILFFLAESVIYLKSLSAYLQMFWPTDRSAQADLLMKDVVSGKYQPSVDIFVPTYSEPVEILRRTILGCQNVAYENKNIYLLDDQRRPEMKALAAELGCHYRDRPDNRDAKAGNMNAALPSSDGDLIAVFDADFVPTADFLMRTVGFFQDEKVGLVQTPQNFYSVDAVSRNLGLPRVLTEEQQVFFRSAQPGRDTLGAMICHGTSFVVRRSAVERIGTFPGETLSEDWATSIKLQSAGYRTYYLNELLSAGAAAEFVTEFVTQRLRWARGTMQCFYASTNPFTVPGLKWWQRLVHLSGPLHYIQYSCRLFCLLLPLVYLLFGIVPVDVSGELLLVFLLPYWVCQTLSLSWLTGGHRSAFWSEVYETMLCVPMTATVISTLIRPFGKPFKVSGKGQTREKLSFNLVLGTPLILFLLLYAMTLSYAVMNASWYPSQSIFALAIGWAVYSMVLIWLSLQAFMDVPQSSARLSFAHRLPAVLWCNGKPVSVTTQEISEYDAVVTVPEVPLETGARGAVLKLELPLQGVEPFRVVNVEVNARAGGWRIEWQHPVPQQHRLLVAHLFGRPGQWDGRGVPEHVTFWHFLQAPFRMHALAETN